MGWYMGVLPAGEGQAEVIEPVVERLAGDRHAEIAHVGEVGQPQPARPGRWRKHSPPQKPGAWRGMTMRLRDLTEAESQSKGSPVWVFAYYKADDVVAAVIVEHYLVSEARQHDLGRG
jgi:hypothetical protein